MSAGNHKSFCGRMKLSRREFIKLSGMMAGAGIIGSWGCADDNSFVLDNPESETDPHIFKGSNAIMIVVDTLRADHLSVYGYGRNTSPNPVLPEFCCKTLIEKLNDSNYHTVMIFNNGYFEDISYIFKETFPFFSPPPFDHNRADKLAIDAVIEW